MTIFTVGHSNHPLETFRDLLGRHAVQVVADLRSSPYARYAVQFNREPLQAYLEGEGIRYLFLGDALGGKPPGEDFYDEQGHVRYDRLAASPKFREGIDRLIRLAKDRRVAVLCGEEDPTDCHRRRLVGRVLCEGGLEVLHIRGDGRLQSDAEVAREEHLRKTGGQKTLFDLEARDQWKSTQSVSPGRAQPSSLGPSSGPEFAE